MTDAQFVLPELFKLFMLPHSLFNLQNYQEVRVEIKAITYEKFGLFWILISFILIFVNIIIIIKQVEN